MEFLGGAKHVIFDMDGVLLDTEHLYTEAYNAVLSPYGAQLDWETKSQLMGRAAHVSARLVIEKFGLPLTPQQLLDGRKPILEGLFRTASPIPGAEDFVRGLKAQGIALAVATSTFAPLYAVKTENHPWFSLFDQIICGDDPEVKQPKPAPDIFHAAAARLGVQASDCVIFEDSPAGVEAALASGARVIALLDPRMDRALYSNAVQRFIHAYAEL